VDHRCSQRRSRGWILDWGGIVYLPRDHGHVVAIADPPVRLAARYQCTFEFINSTNRGPTWAAVCSAMGFQLVPMPQILAGVAPPDGANASGLRNEPAIANGRLYVGTGGGHVYALCPNRRSFDADVRNKMSRVVAAIVFAMLLAVPDLHLAEARNAEVEASTRFAETLRLATPKGAAVPLRFEFKEWNVSPECARHRVASGGIRHHTPCLGRGLSVRPAAGPTSPRHRSDSRRGPCPVSPSHSYFGYANRGIG